MVTSRGLMRTEASSTPPPLHMHVKSVALRLCHGRDKMSAREARSLSATVAGLFLPRDFSKRGQVRGAAIKRARPTQSQ